MRTVSDIINGSSNSWEQKHPDEGFSDQATARSVAREFAQSSDAMRGISAAGTHHRTEDGRHFPAVEITGGESHVRLAKKRLESLGHSFLQVGKETFAIWHPSMKIGHSVSSSSSVSVSDVLRAPTVRAESATATDITYAGSVSVTDPWVSHEHLTPHNISHHEDREANVHPSHAKRILHDLGKPDSPLKNVATRSLSFGTEHEFEPKNRYMTRGGRLRLTQPKDDSKNWNIQWHPWGADKPFSANLGLGKPLLPSQRTNVHHEDPSHPMNASSPKTVCDIIYAGATADMVTASEWKQGEPVEFMYMPSGVHTIVAGFRGKAIKLTVKVVPEVAASVLQGSLEQLKASQPKQLPFGCIEHEEKDASVWARGFQAKDDGVYLCAEPSALGAHHVNGRIHRSWSPSFLTDADYSKAVCEDDCYTFPDGVRGSETNPAEIVGCAFCLGTLTNKPAFREMSPVKAREMTVRAVAEHQRIDYAKAGFHLAKSLQHQKLAADPACNMEQHTNNVLKERAHLGSAHAYASGDPVLHQAAHFAHGRLAMDAAQGDYYKDLSEEHAKIGEVSSTKSPSPSMNASDILNPTSTVKAASSGESLRPKAATSKSRLQPFDKNDWSAFAGAEAHDDKNPPHYGTTKNHSFVVDKHGAEAHHAETGEPTHRLSAPFHAAKALVNSLPHNANDSHLESVGFEKFQFSPSPALAARQVNGQQ